MPAAESGCGKKEACGVVLCTSTKCQQNRTGPKVIANLSESVTDVTRSMLVHLLVIKCPSNIIVHIARSCEIARVESLIGEVSLRCP